jgi:hypothetical protein
MKRLILIAAAALMLLGSAGTAFAGGRIYIYTSGGRYHGRSYRSYYHGTYYYPRRYYSRGDRYYHRRYYRSTYYDYHDSRDSYRRSSCRCCY